MKKLMTGIVLTWIAFCAVTPNQHGAVKAEDRPSNTPRRALTGHAWIDMDYGPYLTASIQVAPGNIAYKGVAIRLDDGAGGVSTGHDFMLFDTDTLRFAGAWTGEGFIDWRNIVFDGSHQTHPSIVGDTVFANQVGPGWGRPADGSFNDVRLRGHDNLPYGPLPRDWARWKGLYLHGNRVVLSYTVGDVSVLELPGLEHHGESRAWTRSMNLGPRPYDLILQVAQQADAELKIQQHGAGDSADRQLALFLPKAGTPDHGKMTVVAVVGAPTGTEWLSSGEGQLRLKIPAGEKPVRLKLLYGRVAGGPGVEAFRNLVDATLPTSDLAALATGGPTRWGQQITTKAETLGDGQGPFAVDVLSTPTDNPWRAWMRLGGFDFFADGRRAAVCTWQGDMWIVDGLGGAPNELTWRRIATGMFQPLGVKIVDGRIYVCCRDQITRLHDLNGDGEIDFYENFNNDHQVTEHFHEFAMDLQTDAAGDFYFAKSARHALDSVVPHHGTLIKVSSDGQKSEIVCNGFRAANGVGIGPNGELATSDQEGHWTPANRINLVQPGGFYGNMFSYHRGERPETYRPPVCWLPTRVDRSPAEQLWIPDDAWGALSGKMLSLSYGTGRIWHVMYQKAGDQYQGGVVRLPLPDFPTGVMRGRFHPDDGQLYACGLFGWSSDKTQPGGFYRVRRTAEPLRLPTALAVRENGIAITFSDPLDDAEASDPFNFNVEQWNYRWTANYGSEHYSVSNPRRQGQDEVEVYEATLSADGRTVFLELEEITPVMQMEISYTLKAADGTPIRQTIWNTIHTVPTAQR